MKKGFTLQEVLITLAIVGVVAALTVPGMVGIMPSRDKIQFLKAYNTFTKIISDIVDSGIYLEDGNCHVFDCSLPNNIKDPGQPLAGLGQFADLSSNDVKLASLVYANLNIAEGNIGDTTFTSTDGIIWTFTNNNNLIDITIGTENYNILLHLDMNGGISPSDFAQALLNEPTKLKTKDFKQIVKNKGIQKREKKL